MKRQSIDSYYLLLAIATVFLDRITKLIALYYFETPIRVTNFLEFVLVFNRGVSWGLLHSERSIHFYLLTLLICAIIVTFCFYTVVQYMHNRPVYAEIMILAGAVSNNMVDRFVYAGVIDFIHVSYGSWSFPVFNVADSAIVLGVMWMMFNARDV